MDIALFTITSTLHDQSATDMISSGFVSEVESALGIRFTYIGADFSTYGSHDLDLIFVRTGGTEGIFSKMLPSLEGNIYLLTSGKSNSLAASMEILSYLNMQERKGEIIHGSIDYIASRIRTIARIQSARKRIDGMNLGVIGAPSDWLISSNADRNILKNKLGINVLDIPIEELIQEIKNLADKPAGPVFDSIPESLSQYMEGAYRIYLSLKHLIGKYNLSGLTLRCFDLLDTVHNTGCVALAMLNSEGIPSSCEGDVPTLVTMAIGNALTGQCGFQANPSRIDPDTGEILLAHCTIPIDMIKNIEFNTHFESGIGIAVRGEMPEGSSTLFKVSGDLSRHFTCEAVLKDNPYERNLCRMQIILEVNETQRDEVCREYLLKKPIGNHHVVFSGSHSSLYEAFMEAIGI